MITSIIYYEIIKNGLNLGSNMITKNSKMKLAKLETKKVVKVHSNLDSTTDVR